MERSLKTSSEKETIRALFATKKAVDSENNLNSMNQENAADQGSLDYDSDRMNDSEREECDDLDESLRKSTKWTDGTDKKLRSLVEEHGTKNWKFIASQLKNKTPVQCLHRWNKILKPGLVKGPWTIEEDRKLLEWVKINGPVKWTSCSDFISGRSGKQCRERWFNTLNPNVKKGGWTPEEDFLIFKFFSEFGSKWSLIASKFPGRTENSVKNRFYSTLRRISLDKKKILFNERKNCSNNNISCSGNSNNNSNNNIVVGNNNEANAEINSGFKNNFINSGNNINNDSSFNNNNNSSSNNNLNNIDNLTVSYPSSNLEELMKYLPQAFAEKTRIYLEYKKNKGQLAENLNVNIESFQDLEKSDLNTLIKNSNSRNNSNNNDLYNSNVNDTKLRAKKASISKKHLVAAANSLENLRNVSTYETKNVLSYNNNNISTNKNFAAVSDFIENGDLNNYTNTNINLIEANKDSLIGEKIVASGLLKKKRNRGEKKEGVAQANQINNTFNFNFNINNNAANYENSLMQQPEIRSKKNANKINQDHSNSEDNTAKANEQQSTLKKKKFVTKKFPKIEELEQLIQNFTESSAKSNSCECSEEDAKILNKHSNSELKRAAKGEKNSKSKAKIKNKFVVENAESQSKALDLTSSLGNNLGSSSSSGENDNSASENSGDAKEFLFKVPEICSNEEVTKLSLNLMQGANYNLSSQSNGSLKVHSNNNNFDSSNKIDNKISKENNCENYLYLENRKPLRSGKSKKSEKEEIFKFDALNNLYDQLNNLENILLNTKKQLFNLDKFFYKEINTESNCFSKSSPENFICDSFSASNKIENISVNLNKLNEGINVIKGLNGADLAQQACLNSAADTQNLRNKNINLNLKEAETVTFTDNKEETRANIKHPNQESMLTLPHIDKNALFLQDDLPYLNINESANMKIGSILNNQNNNKNNNNANINNLFNANLLFNNFEGQIQEEQEFPFLDNMFQI